MLVNIRCPSAVVGRIAFVIVCAINRESILIAVRHCPIVKCLKIVFPFGANCNPSPAVILICLPVRPGASLLHTRPNAVQPRFRHSVGFNRVQFAYFLAQATTRINSPTQQGRRENCLFISAIAPAYNRAPSCFGGFSVLGNIKPTKALPNQIARFRVNQPPRYRSYCGTPCTVPFRCSFSLLVQKPTLR